jgi:hypothetical protein
MPVGEVVGCETSVPKHCVSQWFENERVVW